MSLTAEVAPAEKATEAQPRSLWFRQVVAILRLEVKKNFWGKRAVLIYLLALLPVALLAILALVPGETTTSIRDAQGHIISQSKVVRSGPLQEAGQASMIFAGIFEGLILRTVIFFGCAWIFMNLFRGEVVDRSLHYYFLAPVRRTVLVAGKYFSGLLTSVLLFTGTTLASLFFLYYARGYSQSMQYLFDGPGLGQSLSYLGITVLACIGYGAFFLLIGLFFRNPIIPAVLMYGWEWLNFLLPPLLKKISVIHYLKSLTPIPISEGPFAVMAEPTPALLAVPALLLVTVIVLALASYQIRRMEIKYGSD